MYINLNDFLTINKYTRREIITIIIVAWKVINILTARTWFRYYTNLYAAWKHRNCLYYFLGMPVEKKGIFSWILFNSRAENFVWMRREKWTHSVRWFIRISNKFDPIENIPLFRIKQSAFISDLFSGKFSCRFMQCFWQKCAIAAFSRFRRFEYGMAAITRVKVYFAFCDGFATKCVSAYINLLKFGQIFHLNCA